MSPLSQQLLRCLGLWLMFLATISTTKEVDDRELKPESRCIINEHLILKEKETMPDPFVVCGQIVCGVDGQVTLKRCASPQLPEHCRAGKLLNVRSSFPECCHRETECLTMQPNGLQMWRVVSTPNPSDQPSSSTSSTSSKMTNKSLIRKNKLKVKEN